jgi:hypothetical protein
MRQWYRVCSIHLDIVRRSRCVITSIYLKKIKMTYNLDIFPSTARRLW